MSNLIGKTILVTGATSGIGNAIANKLKESGGNVIGVSRIEKDKHKFDGKCIVIELTNEEQIKEFYKDYYDQAIDPLSFQKHKYNKLPKELRKLIN